mgnify:CR=1 FL=1
MSIVSGIAYANALSSFQGKERILEKQAIELAIRIGFASLTESDESERETNAGMLGDFLREFVLGEVTPDNEKVFNDFLAQHSIDFNYKSLPESDVYSLFKRLISRIDTKQNDATLLKVLNGEDSEVRRNICLTACQREIESFHFWIQELGLNVEGQISAPEKTRMIPSTIEG